MHKEMIMIKILDEDILYRNPLPQLRMVHTCHPVTQQLSKEELLCVYRRGTAFESADGVIGKLRSTDGGKTWDITHQITVWDTQGRANVETTSQTRAIADMSTFGFGKPDVQKLTSGDILASFWRTQACVTYIR
jgi:hypothetical protein